MAKEAGTRPEGWCIAGFPNQFSEATPVSGVKSQAKGGETADLGDYETADPTTTGGGNGQLSTARSQEAAVGRA
jgi:hypothetical protein